MSLAADHSRLARVVVTAPIDKPLDYAVPEDLQERLRIGSRVRVPLGRRQAVGFVVELPETSGQKLKPVAELLDSAPLFTARHAEFYRRAAAYYAYPVGEAFRTALPAGLSGKGQAPPVLSETLYRPTGQAPNLRGERQKQIFDFVCAAGEASLAELKALLPAPYQALQRLVALGALQVQEVERLRDPFAREAVLPHVNLALNTAQSAALQSLEHALMTGAFATFLLHGVTGSGKTEVYLRAAAACLDRGRQVLVLVPEIALTPQLVGRFRSWFQERAVRLAVLHSGLSDGERFDAWRSIARGDVEVVIGARSAVFAPLPEPGLIIVDEEHDASYKQSEGFRYNARDLAQLRGQMEGATVLLGSATPALTSFQRSRAGQIQVLDLPERIADRPLPAVELVDLSKTGLETLLSKPLQEAITETLAAGEQALLLLNRRGYAPFLLCHDCGATCRCPNCAITLTFSRTQNSLRCHYCDFRLPPPEVCAGCGGARMMPEGAGTERLEEELRSVFPEARIARMDRDTTTRKGAHARLLDRVATGDIDILTGTQMIAKGHDFPRVTLVGVLNADGALNLPDFRSAERVFSLLTQMAGRAGRGVLPGRVLIQTYDPENTTLQQVARHAYFEFAEVELDQRELLGYPPFGYLVNLVLAGNDLQRTGAAADLLAERLMAKNGSVEVLGPAPCLLAKLRGKNRFQILLKSTQRQPLRALLDHLPELRKQLAAGITLTIDVDPLDMV